MANYKKLETLVKNFTEATDEVYEELIDNDMVDISTLSDKQKFAVLVFSELSKALGTKEHRLVMDCNYAASKFHNHDDEAEDEYLVDYYRLVPTSNANSTLIQFYVNADPKKEDARFTLCTSCARANREQFEALEDELHFTIKRDKKTGRAKTSQRNNVGYDEIVDIVKAVCAVLANTKSVAEQAKAEKAAANEEAKKAKTTEKKSQKKQAKAKEQSTEK